MNEDEGTTNAELADSIRETFRGDNRPVTVEMLARSYAALVEQQEVSMAMFSAVLKLDPKLLFTDEVVYLQARMKANIKGLSSDLIELDQGLSDE